ncbi:hypothetical protein TWF679_007894 [Orbilia oligospora]|uniref:Uncharacterized protein n=1 Tax=Orbilia oligospora TaxID=2813651 RepID=A0A8H8V619_ORBOL|nr:hypothetical protein TWF679_007894 [Orbilia oligospora]
MAEYARPANSQGMVSDVLDAALEQLLRFEHVPPPQMEDGVSPRNLRTEVPATDRLIDQITDQRSPTQRRPFTTSSLSPQSNDTSLVVDKPGDEVPTKDQKERQRLIFLRNAIELRRRHYARVAGAQKIADYVLQCYSWGYPIDWMSWVEAIPYPQLKFLKRDPRAYKKPQADEPGLGGLISKARPPKGSFTRMEDSIIARIMGMLDFPTVNSLRLAAKSFDNVYGEHWEDICDNIYKDKQKKIPYIPDFYTPSGSPEEDSEEKLRQHHYCTDWVVQSILSNYHESRAMVDADFVRISTNAFLQMALHPPRRNGNGADDGETRSNGNVSQIERTDVDHQTMIVGNAEEHTTFAIWFSESAEVTAGADGTAEEGTGGGQEQPRGRQDAETLVVPRFARPQIMEGETFPFAGLLKYVLEKHLGSPRRGKDNLPRYQKSLDMIERMGLKNQADEKKAFHWALNLALWYLKNERTVYYGIRNEFLNQIKVEDEEETEEGEVVVLTLSDREYVERLKRLKPVQLWELVRLVEVKSEDVITLLKVKGFLSVDEEQVDKAEVMEEFIFARIKQVLKMN